MQALAETINYFKQENSEATDEFSGNILLLTDAEEHGDQLNFTVPDKINLAIAAIGTQSGGRIPLRNNSGVLMGYKKHQGQEVISKLDENNIKNLGKNLKTLNTGLLFLTIFPQKKFSLSLGHRLKRALRIAL